MDIVTKADVVTKAALAENLFNELGLNKQEAKEFVAGFFGEISLVLENGKDVKLSGFGNFVLRYKSSRPGRNPRTGEKVTVSARRVVVFRPGQKLRGRVKTQVPESGEE